MATERRFPQLGEQDPTVRQIIDQIFFLSEPEFEEARVDRNYNLIIVGSGFCALAVAERSLKNDPSCKILILERGPFFLPNHVQSLSAPFAKSMREPIETYPWSLSEETTQRKTGLLRWQRGMTPFFGGRSTTWSGWCTRPTAEEMFGWPEETVRNAQRYFESAEDLLNVQSFDDIAKDFPRAPGNDSPKTSVFGSLQLVVGNLLERATTINEKYRMRPVSLASDQVNGGKFSVPEKLIELATKQDGTRLHIATNCIVERIQHQDGIAQALQTSKGRISIGDANLVLAMGSLPPATLVQNSFPHIRRKAGERFSAHFVTRIAARIPKTDLGDSLDFRDLEMGAFYIGKAEGDYRRQFHIQLNVVSDMGSVGNAQTAHRYAPDLTCRPTHQQLESSMDHVIYICTVLGEMDAENEESWFRHNPDDPDPTTNSILQLCENDSDSETWDDMDEAAFDLLEHFLSPKGPDRVQYWHGQPHEGSWEARRPGVVQRRSDFLIHEASTLHIGEGDEAPVDLNYRLRGTENVYVTGAALWPRGGSWNPTMIMVAMAQHMADMLAGETNNVLTV